MNYFLSLSLLLSPVVGIIAVWLVRPTTKALVLSGKVWRCNVCGHLSSTAQATTAQTPPTCPHCTTAKPSGHITTDNEAESWSFFYRLLLAIFLVFGGLGLFGFILSWLRRMAP